MIAYKFYSLLDRLRSKIVYVVSITLAQAMLQLYRLKSSSSSSSSSSEREDPFRCKLFIFRFLITHHLEFKLKTSFKKSVTTVASDLTIIDNLRKLIDEKLKMDMRKIIKKLSIIFLKHTLICYYNIF